MSWPQRKIFVLGNWKMAQSLSDLRTFAKAWPDIHARLSKHPAWGSVAAGVFPSYVHLPILKDFDLKDCLLGAQDISSEKKGAFTAEVSAEMLKDLNIPAVLIGHSERRQRAQETNDSLEAKLQQAQAQKLQVLFCVGETETERERGQVFDVLKNQLHVLREAQASELMIAYEPVWAIGTGRTPSLDEIREVHSWIKGEYPGFSVLYGGSAKPENAKSILMIDGVDGLLVGGASLKKESFESLLQCALECVDC